MQEFQNLSLLEQLLPLLIPPVVAGLVKLFDRLPKWVVPTLIVPGLGVAGQWISTALVSGDADPLRGVLLGAAAIFVREISSKILKAGKSLKAGEKVPRMGDDAERFTGPPRERPVPPARPRS